MMAIDNPDIVVWENYLELLFTLKFHLQLSVLIQDKTTENPYYYYLLWSSYSKIIVKFEVQELWQWKVAIQKGVFCLAVAISLEGYVFAWCYCCSWYC